MTICTCPYDAKGRTGDLCPACVQHAAEVAQAGQLRDLRLWHWRQLVKARGLARQAVSSAQVSRYNADADTHLHYVQVLNDFFPAGDTAEADATA